MAAEDISGMKFGRLTVLSRCENINGRVAWLCRCDCGAEKKIPAKPLKSGATTSCGCYRRECSVALGGNPEYIAKRKLSGATHGQARRGEKTNLYLTWLRIKKRCNSPMDKDYPNYGGRGITVCQRWDSFEAFAEDMGDKPTIGHQIDRIDPNGPYSPENCRWVTPSVQAQEHKRDLRPTTVDGIMFPSLSAAVRHFGVVSMTTAFQRIQSGYSIEEAIKAPLRNLSRKRPRETYLPKAKRAAPV